MSRVVVNQLQHNTGGSAPAITWFTADGSSGQKVKSTDTAGTLAFTSDLLPVKTQDGNTTMSFPNSLSANQQTFVTNGSGVLTAQSASNPFTINSQQGVRLCDRVDLTTSSPASTLNLLVPSEYTTTGSNVIGFDLRFYGLRMANSGSSSGEKIHITIINQNGATQGSGGSSYNVSKRYNLQSSGTNDTYLIQTGTRFRLNNNTDTYNNQSWPVTSIFANSTANNTNRGIEGAYYGQFKMYNAYLNKQGQSRMNYTSGSSFNDNYEEYTAFQNYVDNSPGHAMGLQLGNGSSFNFCDGLVELYAHFKNGVVT